MTTELPGPGEPPAWAFEAVHLSPYDPGWPARAAAYADELRPALEPWLLSPIEHVGSTSVPGLTAKPVIDLMALVSDLDATVASYIPAYAQNGKGDITIRQLLTHTSGLAPDPDPPLWQYPTYQDRIDALRADPALRDEYAAVKSGLARAHSDDRERYTDEKATFVVKVLRGLGALSVALLCLLVAGCGGGHPWWYESGATSCGPPALLHAAGKVTSLGNCAGVYMPPTQQVTLNVGDTVDLHITQEGGGPSGSSPVPVPPAQLPSVSGSSAVARTAASSDQGTATFKAEHAGQATLVIRGFCLLNGQKRTGCPILDVTVR